jgi:transcriptional regulator with XRE-family HTH domain
MPDPHNQRKPTPEERFAQVVKLKREGYRWSQEDLARNVSLATGAPFHQTGITRIESAKRGIRLNEALVLSDILGIDLTEFGYGDNNPARQRADAILSRLRRANGVRDELNDAEFKLRVEMEALQQRYEQLLYRIERNRAERALLKINLAEARQEAEEAEPDGE